jgi:4-hydroxybutyrate CoA-transferase
MNWQDRFRSKFVSAKQAADRIHSNSMIRFPMAVPPFNLLAELMNRRESLRNVRINQGIPALPYPFAVDPSWKDSIRLETDFISAPIRKAVQQNVTETLVTEYSIGSKVTQEEARRNNWNADVFACMLSEPDDNGVSYVGFSVWHTPQLLKAAKLKIAEIGPPLGKEWPFAKLHGQTGIPLDEFDLLIDGPKQLPSANPLPKLEAERLQEIDLIGAYVSTLVRDNDTLQIGTGTVSSSMGSYLTELRGLGIDSEIIVPSAVELVKCGAAHGRNKTFHKGKATGSLIVPTADFQFVNDNPVFELYDIEYANNLPRIAQIERLVTINQALSIDLTGQVAAESIGPRMWSGPGGQMVWTVGAMYAPSGRAITVLPSTATIDGKRTSRIVPELEPGTIVTVPRTFIDYVVTEHGITNLQGKTQRQRASALIEVADAEFHESLERRARELFGE